MFTFDDVHFGKWLRSWMDANGHSSVWLGKTLGVSERTARSILVQKDPPVDRLKKLSHATGQDLFLLYVSRETRAGNHLSAPHIMPPDDARVMVMDLERVVKGLEKRVERLEEERGDQVE